nr:sterol desaturase family protein [Echinimonas agarilytica]
MTTSLADLPSYLIDANKRIYSLYLLSALGVATMVYWLGTSTPSTQGLRRFLFHPKIWLHDSAKLDYLLFVINRLLKALLWAPLVLTMVPIAIGLSDFLEWVFGSILPVTTHKTVVVASFTLLLFVLDDLTRFLLHLALHKIPFLWAFHKVHHSAKVLTPMTIYRSHPVESFFYACRMALAQGTAVGIGYYLFGPTLKMYDLLGANLFVFVFNIMGSNLRHSHVRWAWGNTIEKWFISPAQHQIHHSDARQHFDKNLGSALAIWDRLAGSLILSSQAPRVRFGLGKHEAHHESLLEIYLEPFKQSALQLMWWRTPKSRE